jgi:hypothetical protein
MSLDLNAVDCRIEDGQIYDAEDDGKNFLNSYLQLHNKAMLKCL